MAAPPEVSTPPPAPSTAAEHSTGFGASLWLFLPFVANDLGNLFVHDAVLWVVQDWAWRLGVLALLGWLARRKRARVIGLGTTPCGWPALVAWTLFTTALGLWLVDGPGRQLLQLWPETRMGFIPLIHSPTLRSLDLTIGLALVALSEEFVFRGVLLPALSRRLKSNLAGLLASSVLFGLAHWSTGGGAVLQTGLAGVLLGVCAQRTRSLWPVVIAHYVINLAAFS